MPKTPKTPKPTTNPNEQPQPQQSQQSQQSAPATGGAQASAELPGPERGEAHLPPDEAAAMGGDEAQANSPAPGAPAMSAQANLDKARVAGILEDIATLLELSGGNPFEVRAYQNAARAISALEGDIYAAAESGQLAHTPGVGKTLLSRVNELLDTGRIQFYEKLLQEVPPGMRQMTRIPGLGAKRVRQLHETLGIASVVELREAAAAGRIAGVPGFGEKMQENILKGVAFLEQHQDRYRFDVAESQATLIAQALAEMPQIVRLDVAGSIRRKRETIGDVDIVGSVATPEDRLPVMNRLVELPLVASVTGHGETKTSVVLHSGIALDVRLVLDDEYPYLLHHFSGSRDHNIALRGLAQKDGIKINEYGLWRGDERIPCKDETDLYRALGMRYIEPELREDRGEIEAALKGTLPTLATEGDLRGVLHVHTNWSDGGNTLREMAEAALKLGFAYLGICDHSQQAAYANGLTPARVREQMAEIDRLNAELGPTFRILKGTECDILRDGALDYDEQTLAHFDFVVASIHSNFNLPPEQQTQRLIRAIQNPYTSIIGHPTGRILLEREGYNPDMEAVIEAAGKQGVAIEINADPHRFDIDWRLLRFATERGVRIPINPDAHSPAGLLNMRYGVGIARKGWLTPFDVLNTLPTDELLAFFAEQRARRGVKS
jgi:DNA polymerase (family 10)